MHWQIAIMCNTYVIKPKRRGDNDLAGKIAEVFARLKSPLIRKSDPGIVIRGDNQVELMRWGFHRSFNPSINNARSDKLEGGMWKEASRDRRCVIPMTLFYEWGQGPGGPKQAHEFRDPHDDYLWAAGIWEEHEELGPCFSMVTTAASPLMARIHDRMPALLRSEQIQEFLSGSGHWDFPPFTGRLEFTPCESPLAKRPDNGQQQAELF